MVEPATPFVESWHIAAICDHLQAAIHREIRRLAIFVPPRHSKSLLTSVFFPTWAWIDPYHGRDGERPPKPARGPNVRFLTASYAQTLATRDSRRSRIVLDSPWYQERWAPHFRLTSDQNEKMRYENDKTGYRIATSVGGAVTGEGGDVLILDDPHKVDEAQSASIVESTIEWFDQTWSTRLNDPNTGVMVLIMQRVSERDVAGHALSGGGWEALILPTEYDPTPYVFLRWALNPVTYATSIGFHDPRTIPGELLNPGRFGPEAIKETKERLGSYGFAAQHQQRPAPAEGGKVKRVWFRYWHHPGTQPPPVVVRTSEGIVTIPSIELPSVFDEIIQSWDMSFKDEKAAKRPDPDYVVGEVWARKGADKFALDMDRDRRDFPATLTAVRALTAKWPQARAKLVEDKANGPAVIATLKRDIDGLIPVEPQGGKAARVAAASPQIESGNVYLPHPAQCPWSETLILEAITFPNGAHDDAVDAMTQALLRLSGPDKLQLYAFDVSGPRVTRITPGSERRLTNEERFLQGLPPASDEPDPAPVEVDQPCVRCGRMDDQHAGSKCAGYSRDPRDAMTPEQRYELGLDA